MDKKPILTLEQIKEITKTYPTPFHVYDEKAIKANAKALYDAFSWNKGYREFFAVKANPNPFILQILKECGCGSDCSSMAELVLSKAVGNTGHMIMFSSNDTPLEEFTYCNELTDISFTKKVAGGTYSAVSTSSDGYSTKNPKDLGWFIKNGNVYRTLPQVKVYFLSILSHAFVRKVISEAVK